MKSLKEESELSLEGPTEVFYPGFHVSGKQMPEIKKWEVGEEYTIKVKIKMVSYSERKNIKKETSSAGFDMLSYDVDNSKNT